MSPVPPLLLKQTAFLYQEAVHKRDKAANELSLAVYTARAATIVETMSTLLGITPAETRRLLTEKDYLRV